MILAGLTMAANFYLGTFMGGPSVSIWSIAYNMNNDESAVVDKAREMLSGQVLLHVLVGAGAVVYLGFLVYVALPGKSHIRA